MSSTSLRVYIDKNELYKLYFEDQLSTKQCANKLNCSYNTIIRRFKKWGWKFRKSHEKVVEYMKSSNLCRSLNTNKEIIEIDGRIYNRLYKRNSKNILYLKELLCEELFLLEDTGDD